MPARGATSNPANRFEHLIAVPDPEAGPHADESPEDWAAWGPDPDPRTQFYEDASVSILSENDSPDIGFRYGLNPYRGCEHGCAYCYARPTHEFLGFGAGVDFESRIMVKRRAPELLRAALQAPRYQPDVIVMSGVTDCYQPAERRFRLTRQCLEVMRDFRQPVGIITKNFLVTRDRDVLAELAHHQCASVQISVTSLDAGLAGRLEPRAARPEHRLRAIRLLAEAGIPVGVIVAPVIPGLTEHELPSILEAAGAAGAGSARYVMLRLPLTVEPVFLAWLAQHEPGKHDRVLARLRELRGGRLNSAQWGERFRGTGVWAEQIRALFQATARRAGLATGPEAVVLSTAHFRRPPPAGQMELF